MWEQRENFGLNFEVTDNDGAIIIGYTRRCGKSHVFKITHETSILRTCWILFALHQFALLGRTPDKVIPQPRAVFLDEVRP